MECPGRRHLVGKVVFDDLETHFSGDAATITVISGTLIMGSEDVFLKTNLTIDAAAELVAHVELGALAVSDLFRFEGGSGAEPRRLRVKGAGEINFLSPFAVPENGAVDLQDELAVIGIELPHEGSIDVQGSFVNGRSTRVRLITESPGRQWTYCYYVRTYGRDPAFEEGGCTDKCPKKIDLISRRLSNKE